MFVLLSLASQQEVICPGSGLVGTTPVNQRDKIALGFVDPNNVMSSRYQSLLHSVNRFHLFDVKQNITIVL